MTLDEIAKETWEGIYKSTKPFGPLAIKQACIEYAREIIPEPTTHDRCDNEYRDGFCFICKQDEAVEEILEEMLSRIEEDSK